MKKFLFIIILLLVSINPIYANTKEKVKFSECVDGDTAYFIYNDQRIKVRFLAVDTPETKDPNKGKEPFGEEASEYTCNKLTNAKKIYLEFDDNSDKVDKYNRYLAWIWIGNNLLQEELVSNGLAKVAYLYGNYSHTELLKQKEEEAKNEKIGIWSEEEELIEDIDDEEEFEKVVETFIEKHKTTLQIIIVIIIIFLLILSNSFRKKLIKKLKSEIRKL